MRVVGTDEDDPELTVWLEIVEVEKPLRLLDAEAKAAKDSTLDREACDAVDCASSELVILAWEVTLIGFVEAELVWLKKVEATMY